jgi:hypothetical protein
MLRIASLVERLASRPRAPDLVKPKSIKSECGAYQLGTHHNSKEWLARNQDSVSEWCDMSTSGLLFMWSNTINLQLRGLINYKSKHHYHLIEYNLFLSRYGRNIDHFRIKQHALTHTLEWLRYLNSDIKPNMTERRGATFLDV